MRRSSSRRPPLASEARASQVGKPNAGKSTLLNALVGQKLSSVTAKPQTTRHRILGILSGPAHQVVLVDTPGVLAVKRTALDGAMMRTVRTALTQADVVAAVVDAAAATRFPGTGLDGMALTGEAGGPPLVVVLTKCDLLSGADAEQLRNYFAALPGVSAALRVSALAKTGLAELEAWVVSRLPLGPALYPKDDVTEHPERFFVAECVREAIFTQYRQEIPYCTTVAVVAHREGRNGAKDVIKVQIAVERESQKGILVGKAGAAIKQLAIASRAAIEEFLQRPVYLEMVVVVAPKWRSDEAAVEKAGVADANALFTM